MKKHIFFFLFFFGSGQLLLSQKNLDSLTADSDWREYYDSVESFYNGHAIANVYGRQALLNKRGREIIPLRYYKVSHFRDGLSWVKFDDGWGAINRKGKVVVPFQYQDVIFFKSHLFARKGEYWSKLSYKGEMFSSDFIYNYIQVESVNQPYYYFIKNMKFGVLDKDGNEMIPPIYQGTGQLFPTNYFIAVKNNAQGILDTNNQVILPFEYEDIDVIKNGKYFNVVKNKKHGIVDAQNKIIIPLEHDDINFNESINIVKNGSNYVVLFKNNKQLKFHADENSQNYRYYVDSNFVAFADNNGKWGIYDADANLKIPHVYDAPILLQNHKHFSAQKNEKQGVVSIDNQELIAFYYDLIVNLDGNDNQYYQVAKDGKVGVLSIANKWILPLEFDNIEQRVFYKNNFLIVQKGTKFGLYDSNGKELLPVQYQRIGYDMMFYQIFIEHEDKIAYIYNENDCKNLNWKVSEDKKVEAKRGVIKTKYFTYFYNEDNKLGGINHREEIILPFEYDSLKNIGLKKHFVIKKDGKEAIFEIYKGKIVSKFYKSIKNSLSGFLIMENGKWGLLNWRLKQVIPCQFDEILTFYESNIAMVHNDRIHGIYDIKKGKSILPMEYQFYRYSPALYQGNLSFKNQSAAIVLMKNDKIGIFDSHGKICLPFEYDWLEVDKNGLFLIGKRNKKEPLIDDDGNVSYKLNFGLWSPTDMKFILPCVYREIKATDGFFIAQKDSVLEIFNTENKLLLKGSFKYDYPYEYTKIYDDKPALMLQKNGLFGIISADGKTILDFEYQKIEENYSCKSCYFVTKNNKMGLFYKGEIKISFEYDDIQLLNDSHYKNYFKVLKNGKYGLLNDKFETIVPFEYENISYTPQYSRLLGFEDGLFIVKRNEKLAYLDKNFKPIFPDIVENRYPKYNVEYLSLADSMILCKSSDRTSKTELDYPCRIEGTDIMVKGYGYINCKGEWGIAPKYCEARGFEEGLAPVKINEKWGYINHKNEIAIPCQFDDAACFKNGFAMVKKDSTYLRKYSSVDSDTTSEKVNIFYFINKKGERASPKYTRNAKAYVSKESRFYLYWAEFPPALIIEKGQIRIDSFGIVTDEYTFPLSEGLQAFRQANLFGFLDAQGKIVVPAQYTLVSNFKNGIARYENGTEYFGLLNKTGKEITKAEFAKRGINEMKWEQKDGLIVVEKENKYGAINEKGEIIIPMIYSELRNFNNGVAMFRDAETYRCGVLNKENKIIIPAEYNEYQIFLQDSMIVVHNDTPEFKLYHINGKKLYESKSPILFIGKNKVQVEAEKILINSQGELSPLTYKDKVSETLEVNLGEEINPLFFDGLAAIEENGRWGYINTKKEVVIPLIFGEAQPFKNGLAIVRRNGYFQEGSKYTIINTKGELLLPFMFDNLTREGERYFKFNNQIIDEKGRVIRE